MAPASAPARGAGGSAVIPASSAVPSVRAYQATPWAQPLSVPGGKVVAPSSSTAAPGATAAKSSFGQPGVPGSVASVTSTPTCCHAPAGRWRAIAAGRAAWQSWAMRLNHDELDWAAGIVGRWVPPTPQYPWPLLAEAVGAAVWVKHENHTPAGAFKVRGGLIHAH